METTNWKSLSPQEQKTKLYLRQKKLLDTFLEHHAISQEMHDKSLSDLTEKMGMQELSVSSTDEGESAGEDDDDLSDVPCCKNLSLSRDTIFTGFYVDIFVEDFFAAGFQTGDGVDLTFSGGQTLSDIPVYDGYYSPISAIQLSVYPGYDTIWVGRNCGPDLWTELQLKEDDTVTITRSGEGAYRSRQELFHLRYSTDRQDYSSDESFANFRSVRTSGMAPEKLFRSASPSDDRYSRAAFSDALMGLHQIRCVLNLSDDERTLRKSLQEFPERAPSLGQLVSLGAVLPMSMGFSFLEESFQKDLCAGLTEMSRHSPPYLIHCTEGKDRTGFVALLLELLCFEGNGQQAYEQTRNEYMETFRNYYNICRDKEPERYDAIVEHYFNPMFFVITGISSLEELSGLNCANAAEQYLLQGGMKKEDIHRLKDNLTRQDLS